MTQSHSSAQKARATPSKTCKQPRLLLTFSPLALLGMAAAVANGFFRVALVPVLVTPLFDTLFKNPTDISADILLPLLLRAGLVVVLGSVVLFLQDAALGATAAQVSATWRAWLYKNLLEQPDLPASSGGLTGRILNDLRDVDIYYQYGLGTLFAETTASLVIVAMLLVSDWQATLLLLGLAVPLVLVLHVLGRRLEQVTASSQQASENVSTHLQEGFKHHTTIRALGLHGFMEKRVQHDNIAAQKLGSRRSFWAALQIPTAQALVFLGLGIMVLRLLQAVQLGRLSMGEVMGYITLVTLLSTPVQLLPKGYAMLTQARAAAVRLRSLAAIPTLIEPKVSTAINLTALSSVLSSAPTLRLEHLTFSYDRNEHTNIFADVSLTLQAPALIAIVGASGSGKTTLCTLLLRLRQPTAGKILFNEISLAEIPEAQLRQSIGYLPQMPLLFHGTLKDNLCLGKSYPETQLWQVLETVKLASEFQAKGWQLEHHLGEDGAGLSGGQRQRLALARLLLRQPQVIILDEPSASLDPVSEQVIVSVVMELARAALVLVVAHTPAFVKVAKARLVMEDIGVRLEPL